MTDTPNNLHNNPPDPIEAALAPFKDSMAEALHWLDGKPVENEAQMKAVDVLIKAMRDAKGSVAKAKKSATAPLHDAWKAEIAKWNPTEEDVQRRLDGLVAVAGPYRQKLAAEKDAVKRAAREAARQKVRDAEAAAAKAVAGDYESQLTATLAKQEAMDAKRDASDAGKDKVKGLREVTKFEVTDDNAVFAWILENDPDAFTAFINEYARCNHKKKSIDGVNVWKEKVAH